VPQSDPARRRIVLTCEHGGNRVPRAAAKIFRGWQRYLQSHRGWDPDALAVARLLANRLDAPLVASTHTRLLVDLNRSPHNPAVFSIVTRDLPRAKRVALLERWHRPHWEKVRAMIDEQAGPVLHVAVHSFTPVLRGRRRNLEIGLLYDPRRGEERTLALELARRLRRERPDLRVRRNQPYQGVSDGLATALRRELPASRYLGLEIELNQRALARAGAPHAFAGLLARVLSPD
jgi:predicted N-formylglutamate amidohydrolase